MWKLDIKYNAHRESKRQRAGDVAAQLRAMRAVYDD